MENVKYGNLEKKECKNVRKIGKMKNDNRNKRGNIAGGGGNVKTRKGLGRIYYLAINHTANYISSIQTEYERIL